MIKRLKVIQKPWVSALLLVLLVADTCVIATYGRSTVAGYVIDSVLHPGTIRCYFRFTDLYAHVQDGSVRVIDQDVESWDTLSELVSGDPESLYWVSVDHDDSRSGPWAPLLRTVRYEIAVFPMADGLIDPPIERRIRAAVADFMGAYWEPDTIATLRMRDISATTIDWIGVAHNALAGLSFVVFLCSLGWVPEIPSRWRRFRRRRALARDMCPRCGYSITGLPDHRCPECDEQWAAAELVRSGD